jgi:thymidylate synthase (FAD)
VIKISTLEIKCLSKPNFNIDEFQNFLAKEDRKWLRSGSSESDELVEAAGRVCYMSFGKGNQSEKNNKEYIKNLIEQGHESVLEHISWTFLLTGVSRAFTHQLVRHRVGFSYSQLSQQYHDESESSFVVPPTIGRCEKLLTEWKTSIEHSLNLYKRLINEIKNDDSLCGSTKKEKMRDLRSASRSILPNATETKIVVTANARALRHFFTMRGALDGDWEMRSVSCALFEIVREDAPSTFQDFEMIQLPDDSNKLIRTS